MTAVNMEEEFLISTLRLVKGWWKSNYQLSGSKKKIKV